ncbi:hypothetical protein VDS34_22615, partial [Xanthomonas campestris pv. campestris]|nr:hypothetical protein [Xanthomonas campestris pv. campestris]MEB1718997.1 hypothetical protein [Xanthomonas campestris pv. campestris]MEB2125947.1 hypothetical protein [Xanthomonas campestris pv. campestris]
LARTACGSARADDAYGVKRGDTLEPGTVISYRYFGAVISPGLMEGPPGKRRTKTIAYSGVASHPGLG